MKIKLVYVILIFLFCICLRIYNQVYSEFHPICEEVKEEITSKLNSDTGIVCL